MVDELSQEIKEVNHALSQEIKEVKTAVDKLDSRLFERGMRIVTANSSAFFGVGIALPLQLLLLLSLESVVVLCERA